MTDTDTTWRCYARPATQGGRECGHVNTVKRIYCAACGCTKVASDARQLRAEGKS